jgi:hypothetical protein
MKDVNELENSINSDRNPNIEKVRRKKTHESVYFLRSKKIMVFKRSIIRIWSI